MISEKLFYEVQDVLNGNKRPVSTKAVSSDQFPLRGFLSCPKCHRMLTGSASKGRNERYYYYHCSNSKCGSRFKAEKVNRYFEDHLMDYNLDPRAGELFKMVVLDLYASSKHAELDDRKSISIQIELQESMLSSARKKLMNDEIDSDDFKAIKAECNQKLKQLEAELDDMPTKTESLRTIENLLDIVIEKYADICGHYRENDVSEQRRVIGSMYPENLCFDGTRHRTAYFNEPLDFILLVNKELQSIKKGENFCLKKLSPRVAQELHLSNSFNRHLMLLASIGDPIL